MLKPSPAHSMTKNLHVLAIAQNDNVRKQTLEAFQSSPDIICQAIVGDGEAAKKYISAANDDSIFLLEINSKDTDVPGYLARCKEANGNRDHNFIIVSGGLDDKTMVELMRMGVSDFLSLPLNREEAIQSVGRVAAKRGNKRSEPQITDSSIITFVHASGGMGATTLAVNAATLINAANVRQNQQACLLDLDLQYGGASLQLDLPDYSPVMSLLENPERLDHEMLDAMMIRHSSGLRVLTTPETPLPVEAISSDTVNRLLRTAQSRYPHIIVDMPQAMTMWTDTVLKKSKVIYAVTQLNVPGIRQLRRWLSTVEQEGLYGLPIKVVVNRHVALGRLRHDNISPQQASEALGRHIDYLIPNDYELISQSLDQGLPAASISPNSKFTNALREMLSATADGIETPKKKALFRKY